jgi:lipoprotein-anchoring transpeptidase ErfK/SrfK
MDFRTAGAIATLLLGLQGASGQALAQYYPPSYPPAPVYPPYRSLPPINVDDDSYDAQGRPFPPAPVPQAEPMLPPGTRLDRGTPVEEAELPPPVPGYFNRNVTQPAYRDPPAIGYREPPPPPSPPLQAPQGYEPAAAGSRPYYGALPPAAPAQPEPDGFRPPMPIGPGQFAAPGQVAPGQIPPGQVAPGQADPNATGAVQRMAALPPEVRPETGPTKELPLQFRRTLIDYRTKEPAGTIIIDTSHTYLYLVLGNGKALRYGVGVGREGFTWAGAEKVTRMAEWPDWHPPEEMIDRQPYLPRFMAGGPGNPLGARALYLGSTIYRIHGTNQPSTIGTFVSSGCIRLTNEDVMDLYSRVKVGTRVVVLPGSAPPATASAAPVGPPMAVSNGAAPTASPPAAVPPPGPPFPPPGPPPLFGPPLGPPFGPPSAMAR